MIRYGYKKIFDEFLFVANWIPIIHSNIHTTKASLTVEIPADYPVNISQSEGLEAKSEIIPEGYKRLTWQATDMKAFKEEWKSPPLLEWIPSVEIVPQNFQYGLKGSFESWKDYGQWQYSMNDNLDELTTQEQEIVTRLLDGVVDKKEKMRRLYHHLQDNTRYINVAIDLGGLKPFPAAYVCEKKYGDCKALSNYMKALLKFVGIESYYVKIYAGENPVKIKTDFPSQQFNHVVLCAPIDGDTVWFENTSSYNPFNYLGVFTQNRHALLVDGNNSRLVRTPGLMEADVQEVYTYRLKLDQNGHGTGNWSGRVKGDAFETYLALNRRLNPDEFKRYLEKVIPLKHLQVMNVAVDQKNRDMAELQIDAELNLDEQIRSVGKSLVFNPVSIGFTDLEKPEIRKLPLRIPYPLSQTDSVVYDLNFDVQSFSVQWPDPVFIDNPFGKFEIKWEENQDHQIVMTRHLSIKSGQYSKEEYAGFYDFMKNIASSVKKSIVVFNPK